MSDNNSKLNRRRLLVGLIIIGIAAAGAGAGTVAYFSDTEQSAENTIVAGTLDLSKVTTASSNVTNIAPGDQVPTSGTMSFATTYQSTDSIGENINVNISVATSHPAPGVEPAEPDHSINVSATQYAQQLNVTSAVVTVGGTTDDVTASYNTLADLSGSSLTGYSVAPGETVSLDLSLEFNKNAGNDYQADGVNMTVTFDGDQIPAN